VTSCTTDCLHVEHSFKLSTHTVNDLGCASKCDDGMTLLTSMCECICEWVGWQGGSTLVKYLGIYARLSWVWRGMQGELGRVAGGRRAPNFSIARGDSGRWDLVGGRVLSECGVMVVGEVRTHTSSVPTAQNSI
jgi:hypothetical protein